MSHCAHGPCHPNTLLHPDISIRIRLWPLPIAEHLAWKIVTLWMETQCCCERQRCQLFVGRASKAVRGTGTKGELGFTWDLFFDCCHCYYSMAGYVSGTEWRYFALWWVCYGYFLFYFFYILETATFYLVGCESILKWDWDLDSFVNPFDCSVRFFKGCAWSLPCLSTVWYIKEWRCIWCPFICRSRYFFWIQISGYKKFWIYSCRYFKMYIRRRSWWKALNSFF